MALIVTMIIGGVVGFLASLIIRAKEGLIADVLVGILGSIIGLWFFSDVLGLGSSSAENTLSVINLLWGIVGAIALIALVEAISYEPKESMKKYDEEIFASKRPIPVVAHEYKKEKPKTTTRRKK